MRLSCRYSRRPGVELWSHAPPWHRRCSHFAASGKTEKFQVPSLDEILSEDGVPHYAYEKTFDEVANTTHMVVHTSGSSGSPKPINWTVRSLCSLDSGWLLPTDQRPYLTRSFVRHQNVLLLLPCFHVCMHPIRVG